jgi:hypothetical protein
MIHTWNLGGIKMGTSVKSARRENFVRLAEARVERALGAIRVIGNLSNRGNYEYTDNDVKVIISTLQREVKELEQRFKQKDGSQGTKFKLVL